MAAAIGLREGFGSAGLRAPAKSVKGAAQARRLLALAVIYDGGSPTDAARIGGVGLQIVRDWVLGFNARGPDRLIDGKAPGNSPKLSDAQRAEPARIVERGVRRCRSDHWRSIGSPRRSTRWCAGG
jgi:transposase